MKFPSVLVSALIVGVLAVLQHLLGHVGEFNVPELYAPIVVVILNTLIKMVQEWNPPVSQAAARGEVAQDSYVARVLGWSWSG